MIFSFKHKLTIFLFFEAILLSPYFSSWLPMAYGIPVGPIIRGGGIVIFYIVFLYPIIFSPKQTRIGRFKLFIILLFLGSVLVAITNEMGNVLQIIIGLHAFIFYPFTFIVLYLYMLRLNIAERKKTIDFLISLISVNLILTSLIAITDVISGGEFTLLIGYDPHYGGDGFSLINRYYDIVRANGGFADALAFGYFMVIGIVLSLYQLKTTLRVKDSYYYIIIFTLCLIATFLSITRGAIAAGLCIFVFYAIRNKRMLILMSLLFCFLTPILSIKYYDVFVGRFTDSDAGSSQSTKLRYDMAIDSINFLAKEPMGVGIGTQGGGNVLSEHDKRINTDNFIFHAFIELGVLGGISYYMFILLQFFLAYNRYNIMAYCSMSFLFLLSIMLSSSMQSGLLAVSFWLMMLIVKFDVKRERYA
ncbi:O-antigen ligase family protein [Aeromonas enteropelogenes]|uniref:O-antigen ligase family protein n=1 Tax=Aeromonas enteropelogenes TaxID=29489 RepID=UPI003BA38FF9